MHPRQPPTGIRGKMLPGVPAHLRYAELPNPSPVLRPQDSSSAVRYNGVASIIRSEIDQAEALRQPLELE